MTTTSSLTSDGRDWPEFVGSWPRLTGRQEPEFESRHPGDESMGDLCAIFGGRIGLRCMPWEWRTVCAILSLQPANEWGERLWTHRDVAIECTRQQGKTLIIVLLILWGLFKRGERIVYTAQRWSTAEDVYERVLAVIDQVPSLKRRLAQKPTKGGNRGLIKLTSGAKVEFGPRSQDFGRGYTELDRLFVDEAYDVDPGQEANLTGAQSAASNPQTIYVSTPPVAAEHPKCQVLAGLHRLGFANAPDLYYALYAAPRDMPRDSPQSWALAQPSYGVATNEREIRSKRQKAKTAAQVAIFDADYMGWGEYPPDEDEVGSPIPENTWEEMTNLSPNLIGPRTIAVHRSRDRKRWAIAAAQRTDDGRVHIEIGPLRSGSHADFAEYLVTKVTDWNPVSVVIDQKSPAQVLEPILIEAGIEPTMTNSVQLAKACSGFLDDAIGGRLSQSDQAIFNDAIASAAMRELPAGGFAWVDDSGGASVPLVAATLAHWALLTFGAVAPKRKTVGARSGLTTDARYSTDDYDAMTAAF